jgi:hypothetical protein
MHCRLRLGRVVDVAIVFVTDTIPDHLQYNGGCSDVLTPTASSPSWNMLLCSRPLLLSAAHLHKHPQILRFQVYHDTYPSIEERKSLFPLGIRLQASSLAAGDVFLQICRSSSVVFVYGFVAPFTTVAWCGPSA